MVEGENGPREEPNEYLPSKAKVAKR